MTDAEILKKVVEIIENQLGIKKEKITLKTKFSDDLGADSLDTVELMMALEDEFDITIKDEETENIKTVGNAVEYIKNCV